MKTLFYRALYGKMVDMFNREHTYKSRFIPTDKAIDFAEASPHALKESLEVQQFIMQTDKELASIIKLLVQGYSYRDIAEKENISKSEVGNRVKEIRAQWIAAHEGEM